MENYTIWYNSLCEIIKKFQEDACNNFLDLSKDTSTIEDSSAVDIWIDIPYSFIFFENAVNIFTSLSSVYIYPIVYLLMSLLPGIIYR